MTSIFRPAASLLGATALALMLSGCKIDNRPLLARGEPPPGAPALGPLDPTLGAATPAAYPAPDQAYAYPQRAYAVSRSVIQRRPNYAFAYGDEQPWAWDTADQGLMFAEPVDDSWRYYYYEPGADYPYFVQDRDYGYAYGNNGVLLALFDAAGALIAADRYHDYAPRASSYWTRAYDLHQTYWRSPRHPVEETIWRTRAPAFTASHERWFRGVSTQPAWTQPSRHDNGRHLGWSKDHGPPLRSEPARSDWNQGERGRGGRDRGAHDRGGNDQGGRQAAFAPAAPQGRPEPHSERAPSRDAHAWKQARQEARPQPAARPASHNERAQPRDAHAWKQARQEARPQQAARRDVRSQAAPDHGRGHDNHGGQAFARAAQDHARPAAARGPAQAHGKPNPAGGQPHGGGGHDKGKGGGGGGKGGGHDKAGHDHGH